jgi:hypothetical protein
MAGGSKKRKDGITKPFQGPVLFVNHGVGDMGSIPHRHEVFTHVQNNYRRWRRYEDAKSIRAGVRLPTTVTTFGPGAPAHARRFSGVTSSRSLSRSESAEEREALRTAELQEALKQSNSPVTLLKEGNSDPFSAFSFKVDPQANELIGFYRDYIIPCIYHTTSRRKALSNTSAQRDFNDVIDGLKDEGGAYGFLARNAFVAARSNSAMRKAAAIYGDKSVKLLSKKVAKGKDLQTQKTYWHVNNLWAAETIDGNMMGALAHGKMLRFLFEQQVKEGKVDFKFLLYVIYTDCQMSATFLISPVFDVEQWLPQVLRPLSRMAEAAAAASLPTLSEDVIHNDPSIDDPELQEIFTARRQGLYHWVSSATQMKEVENSQIILAWIVFRAVISQGKMIKYYLKKNAELEATNSGEEKEDGQYAQVYLALAAIYLTRLISFNNTVLGTPMFDAGPNILARLRERLEDSDRLPGGLSFHRYNNARLWAFYVGAFGEQLNATMKKTEEEPCEQWFNRKLAEQAYIMDALRWEQAREIFKGFLYTDLLPPSGATWFDKTLKAHEAISPT